MKKSSRVAVLAAAAAAAAGVLARDAEAALSFTVDPNGWDSAARRDAAVWSIQQVVNRHNAYGDFGNYNIWVYYHPGIPTAQAGYGGWGGSIGFGGTWPNERVTLHEANHYLGSGTHSSWYDGPRAVAILEQFDGVGARFGSGGSHFWPYGMNYDNEWSEVGAQRNIALMYALRADWGIGSTANPAAWAATSVSLKGDDAGGTSGFNFGNNWSDNTFAHPNAAYSTGAFSVRTPQGYPSWKFAGSSLTVNAGGRLLYNGWGTTGVVTINNLVVNGGTVRHDQFPQDLFQLAGNVNLASTATFEAANGDIKVLAPIAGAGSLVKAGNYALTLTGPNSFTGSTTVNAGKLVLNNVGLPNTAGVNVISGATLNARGNIMTGGTLTSSGVVDLVDDALNTLTVGGGLNLNSSTLNLQLGSAGGDRIAAAGAATVSGTNTVNVTFLPGQNPTSGSSYTLVTAAGGLSAANFNNAVSKPASLGFYQFNLSTPTPTALLMNVTGNPTPAVAYWTGQASVASADANNNWGTGPGINQSNWSTNAAGTSDPLQLPGSTTSVIFNAANATGVAGTLTTRLDSAYAVGALTIDVPAGPGIASTVLNTNGNSLAIGSGGLTVAASSASSATINGGSVQLNGSQSWANNSNARSLNVASGISAVSGATTLTFAGTGTGGVNLSGPISDGGGPLSVVFNQAGTTTLTGSNGFTGSVAVNGGTVFANPGNAANNRAFSSVSGITVNNGATLRAGANGLFGWDGAQDRPITVNAGGTLAALGTATTDVGVGLVTLNGGTLAASGTTASDYGSFRFDQAADKLLVTENSTVSAQRVKFGDPNAAIEVAAGKTLNFTGTVTDTTAGGISHLNKSGPGLLSMTAGNTYSGGTVVRGGTLGVTGSINSTGVVSVGDGNAANGTLNVGSTGGVTGYEVWFGQSGSAANAATGVGTVAAGGVVNSVAWTGVGRTGNSSSSGTLTLNGGTLNVKTGGAAGNLEVAVFDAVSGTVNVNANSTVRLQSNANILLGSQDTSGNGTINQNGGNVTFFSNGGSTVGGSGALTLGAGSSSGIYAYNLNGGTLTTPQVNKTSTNANARGHFHFNGGTLKAAAASTSFMQGLTSATVNTGGAIVDTNGHDVTIAQPLTHAGAGTDGGLTKQGNGVLTLTHASTYNGNTTISGGTLRLGQLTGGSIATTAIANYTFDSVTGNTVNNGGTGGAPMNGALAGGASIVAGGRAGNAVSVSGGASVNINNPITDLGNAADWSVSAWVKTATPGSSILSKGSGSGWASGNTILYLGDGTAGGSGGIPSGVRYAGGFFQGSTGATPVNDNSWHQVTYVNRGGAYSLYVDGVAQPLSPGNAGFSTADVGAVVRLGVSTNTVAGDGAVNFNGQLDDVQFYGRALAPDQVAALFQGQISGSLPTTTQLSIASGATFDLNGLPQQVASIGGPAGSAVTLGTGQLTVSSPSGNTQFAGTISGAGGSLVKGGNSTLTLTGANAHTGGTAVSAGTLVAGHADALGAGPLVISNGATARAQPALPKALDLTGLTMSAAGMTGGTLDLADGAVVLRHASQAAASAGHAAVNNLTRNAFNEFAWNQPGITSSEVAADIAAGVPAALGVLLNNDGGGGALFYGDGTALPQFEGRSVDGNSVLTKYTLLGDGDLNGTVDSVDFALFQAGYTGAAPYIGFAFGDYDYNGLIDSVDFGLFQAGYQYNQSNPTPEMIAFAGDHHLSLVAAAVPEPTSFALLALGALAGGRRRRRT